MKADQMDLLCSVLGKGEMLSDLSGLSLLGSDDVPNRSGCCLEFSLVIPVEFDPGSLSWLFVDCNFQTGSQWDSDL